ncbi:hypothetical protein [Promicromonospora sp. NPDC059942]|uniref:hypothetical protein n=1 Tax=Promicromonospora sp. NPDC059942 TaxID=3347009 RepID=UPI003650AE6F
MSLRSDLEAYTKKTHDDVWQQRKGRVVPSDDSITLGTDSVEIDATVLYADLAESTSMVAQEKNWFAAEVYKNYLYCAARIIRAENGTITAYDGDRIMAVFLSDNQNTQAVRAAMKIQWATAQIIQPAIDAKYKLPGSGYTTSFKIKQKVGVDTSILLVAKTGIRGHNDLVWVGSAANNAAKMAALDAGFTTYITRDVYRQLPQSRIVDGEGKNMWRVVTTDLGHEVIGTTYRTSID